VPTKPSVRQYWWPSVNSVNVNILDFLQTTDIGEVQDRIVWHRSCYSNCTHSKHMASLQKRYEKHLTCQTVPWLSAEASSSREGKTQSRPISRSLQTRVICEKCIFCPEEKPGKKLRNIATFETSESDKTTQLKRCNSEMPLSRH